MAAAHRARPWPPALRQPAGGKRLRHSSLPDAHNASCAKDVAGARNICHVVPLSSPLYRNAAISGTIIDFDTFSHARMHTAAAFKTRPRRDHKKLSPMTLNDYHHTQKPHAQNKFYNHPVTFVNRYTMQRCTISCLRDPR